jgi:N-acetylmuramoyl-L-alanine amidase
MRPLFLFLVFVLVLAGCGETVVPDPEPPPGGFPGSNPFQSVVVTGSVVNLRQGPGTQYAVVGSASSGDTLMVTGEAPDWYRVYVPEKSLFAWIYSPLTSGATMPGSGEQQ